MKASHFFKFIPMLILVSFPNGSFGITVDGTRTLTEDISLNQVGSLNSGPSTNLTFDRYEQFDKSCDEGELKRVACSRIGNTIFGSEFVTRNILGIPVVNQNYSMQCQALYTSLYDPQPYIDRAIVGSGKFRDVKLEGIPGNMSMNDLLRPIRSKLYFLGMGKAGCAEGIYSYWANMNFSDADPINFFGVICTERHITEYEEYNNGTMDATLFVKNNWSACESLRENFHNFSSVCGCPRFYEARLSKEDGAQGKVVCVPRQAQKFMTSRFDGMTVIGEEYVGLGSRDGTATIVDGPSGREVLQIDMDQCTESIKASMKISFPEVISSPTYAMVNGKCTMNNVPVMTRYERYCKGLADRFNQEEGSGPTRVIDRSIASPSRDPVGL